jgi:hypothetical protein
MINRKFSAHLSSVYDASRNTNRKKTQVLIVFSDRKSSIYGGVNVTQLTPVPVYRPGLCENYHMLPEMVDIIKIMET